MGRVSAYARAARAMPPDLLAAKVLRRLGLDIPTVRRAEMLADPKAKDPARLARLLEMVDGQLRAAGAPPVALENARVLEIGCGRLGGFGVAATVAGAARYLGVDPGVEPAALRHPAVVRRYLDRALAATAERRDERRGVAGDTATLRRRFFATCRFHAGPLDTLDDAARDTDLVLSVSCLEHIHGLEPSLARLRTQVAPGARQVHVVNFSNHTDKKAPFAGLYETAPEAYARQFGGHINLLRPPDILAAFRAAGFDARLVPQDVRPDLLPPGPRLHPWWTARYGPETLAIRTALLMVG